MFVDTVEKDSNFGVDNLRKGAQGGTDLLGTLAQRVNNGNQIKTGSIGIKGFNLNLGMFVAMEYDFIPCLGLRPEIKIFELFLIRILLYLWHFFITLIKVKS